MNDAKSLSQINQQLMWNRLLAVVEEQAQTLIRTAFSTTVREAGDVSVGVFDLDGRMMAQAVTGTPGHVNSMMTAAHCIIQKFPANVTEEGDAFITNDPWVSCGHLHDFTVMTPVFVGAKLAAYVVSTAHVVDIGGRGLGPEGREVFEEGLFIPIARFARRGQVNELLLEIIRENVREPLQVVGDLTSLLTCNEDGARRLARMAAEFNLASFQDLADYIDRTSYRASMDALSTLPRGTWTQARTRDGYDFPVRLEASLKVHDMGVHVDYDGTSGPSKFGINVVLNYTTAYTVYTLKCLLAPDCPNNSGSLRPFTVSAPEGCILNVKRPGPVAARHIIGHMVPDMVMACLEEVVPDRVLAEGSGTIWNPLLRGGTSVLQEGLEEYSGKLPPDFMVYHFNSGGMGARAMKDGLSATAFPSGVTTQSVEVVESIAPIIFWRKELREDSGGPGKFRGGLGQMIEIGGSEGNAISNHSMFDRIDHPALGRFGGLDGQCGSVALASGAPAVAKGKMVIKAGDRMMLSLPGGAGYGNPLERDRASVARDVAQGYVSRQAAREYYGMDVLADADSDTVDAARAAGKAVAAQHE